jgi:hypothetical protein
MRAAEGGWRVWFRGNGTNVIRLVPEVGFKFAVHDQFRRAPSFLFVLDFSFLGGGSMWRCGDNLLSLRASV